MLYAPTCEIRAFVLVLTSKLGDLYGKPDSEKFDAKDYFSNGYPCKIEDALLHKTLELYMKDNPGQIINLVTHCKGSSVVDKWMENHPNFSHKRCRLGEVQGLSTPNGTRKTRFLHTELLGSELVWEGG